MSYRVAVASTDGKVVNQHFGKAEKFYILEADEEGSFACLEIRKVNPVCEGGEHNDTQLEEAIKNLQDCPYVLVSRVGNRAEIALDVAGIRVFELPGLISDSVVEMVKYLEIQNIIHSYTGEEE